MTGEAVSLQAPPAVVLTDATCENVDAPYARSRTRTSVPAWCEATTPESFTVPPYTTVDFDAEIEIAGLTAAAVPTTASVEAATAKRRILVIRTGGLFTVRLKLPGLDSNQQPSG